MSWIQKCDEVMTKLTLEEIANARILLKKLELFLLENEVEKDNWRDRIEDVPVYLEKLSEILILEQIH